MSSNPLPDWERIEQDYRAGILSLREIAARHPGANHVAIARRAKKESWAQDLSARIKAKADDLVTKQAVTNPVTEKQGVSDRAIVEANAQAIATIRLSHRKDISRSRTLAMALLEELEVETSNVDALHHLGEMMRSPDDKGVDKLNELYQKIISLPSRTDTMKKLSETLKNVIGLEREAYGFGEAPAAPINNQTINLSHDQLTKRVGELQQEV